MPALTILPITTARLDPECDYSDPVLEIRPEPDRDLSHCFHISVRWIAKQAQAVAKSRDAGHQDDQLDQLVNPKGERFVLGGQVEDLLTAIDEWWLQLTGR